MGFINIFTGSPKKGPVKKEMTKTGLPQIVVAPYTPNFDTFYHWSKFHRDHQKDALKAMEGQSIGQICLPTGTGKTRVQIAVHIQDMIKMLQDHEYGVFTTSAHRLALCNQLLEEMIAVAVNAGIPFDILFVGSSRFPDDKVHAKFKNKGFNRYVNEAVSTTQGDDIKRAVRKAHMRERHVICVSTYHSFDRLNALDKIDVCTYDEAHVVIGEDFMKNILQVREKIKRNFFFTATRRVQGDFEGMNNEAIFGKILSAVSPRKMIDVGEIVPPKLHIIKPIEEGDYDNHTMLVKTVIVGHEQHRVLVNESSCDPDAIGAKLLITTTGNLEMFELHDDEKFQQYCQGENINVFAFSSERGSFMNFKSVSREEAMRRMRDMDDTENAIMLHIDILAEGIDLPSITGVMPFRELNTGKLLQTIGRSARLIAEDRRRLYSGEVVPKDWKNYVKPCCWVIFPQNFKSLGNAEAMKKAIHTIINTYAIPSEEYNTIDKYLADVDDDADRITAHDTPNRKDKETDLTHLIEEVMIEKFSILSTIKNPLQVIKNLFGR